MGCTTRGTGGDELAHKGGGDSEKRPAREFNLKRESKTPKRSSFRNGKALANRSAHMAKKGEA